MRLHDPGERRGRRTDPDEVRRPRSVAGRKEVVSGSDFDGREVQPPPFPFDSEDHGTHTAATIVGRPVMKRHVGVAPKADLPSGIVIEGGDIIARVLGGMDWAVGLDCAAGGTSS